MELKKILGDVRVTGNGNGYTARHLGKTASSTCSREAAMSAVLAKVYGKAKHFYFCHVDVDCPPNKNLTDIFMAVSETEEEGNCPAQP